MNGLMRGLEAGQQFQMNRQRMAQQAAMAPLQQQLLQSQAARQNALATGQSDMPMSPFGKAQKDYQHVVSQFGANSPQAKQFEQYLSKLSQGQVGPSMVFGANGQLQSFSMGGPASAVQGNGLVKNPAMGSMRSGAGGTYVDPKTGQAISTNTIPRTTADQQTIASVDNATPMIHQLMKTSPQFQSVGKNILEKGEAMVNSVFPSANLPLPNEYAKAQSALEIAPESLLKGYGLNVTDESLKTVRNSIKPKFGETPNAYRNRLLGVLNELRARQNAARGRLMAGNSLNANRPENFMQQQPLAQQQTAPQPQQPVQNSGQNNYGYNESEIAAYAKKTGKSVADIRKLIAQKLGGKNG